MWQCVGRGRRGDRKGSLSKHSFLISEWSVVRVNGMPNKMSCFLTLAESGCPPSLSPPRCLFVLGIHLM